MSHEILVLGCFFAPKKPKFRGCTQVVFWKKNKNYDSTNFQTAFNSYNFAKYWPGGQWWETIFRTWKIMSWKFILYVKNVHLKKLLKNLAGNSISLWSVMVNVERQVSLEKNHILTISPKRMTFGSILGPFISDL